MLIGLLPIISKSSTYKQIAITLVTFTTSKYTPCSIKHFKKPTLWKKVSILLFEALGAYLRP